jgi:NADH-quinone oxidoreductase subunit G
VGALTSTAYRFRARPWDIEDSGSVCTLCPSHCNVKFTIRDDARVVRVLARDNEAVDDGWLCDKGRYGYQVIHSKERITAPMASDGGTLREVSWERALSEAAEALRKAGERSAALVGGQATNEEGFLVQHLMRKALGSPHVDSRFGGGIEGVQARVLARPDLSASVEDIERADAILVLETELVDEAPILDLRVRKAVRRNGARLVVATSRPSTLDPNAATLRFAPGAAEAAVGALAAAVGSPRAAGSLDDLAGRARTTQGVRHLESTTLKVPGTSAVRAVADVLRDADDVVVIWGERLASGERGAQAIEAILALAAALGLERGDVPGILGPLNRQFRKLNRLPLFESRVRTVTSQEGRSEKRRSLTMPKETARMVRAAIEAVSARPPVEQPVR